MLIGTGFDLQAAELVFLNASNCSWQSHGAADSHVKRGHVAARATLCVDQPVQKEVGWVEIFSDRDGPVRQLVLDPKTMRDEVLEHPRLEECRVPSPFFRESFKTADKAAIADDIAKIHADRGNAAALASDEAQLATDRTRLATDAANARAKERSDSASANAAIAAGQQAIRALHAGTATDALKLRADAASWAATLAADRQAVAADRTQLARDVTA